MITITITIFIHISPIIEGDIKMSYNGTVWALQCVCKEDMCPDTIETVFLDKESTILDATKALKLTIHQEIYDRCDADEERPDDPESLLEYLTYWFNSRSLSYFVVRIFPPSKYNLQKDY